MARGRHRLLRRPGSLRRAWKTLTTRHPRTRTVKAPRWKTGGRDGLVVSGAMAVTLGAVGLAAVLTPGGARLAPVLAEIVPVPTAPAPEAPDTVFTPPAELSFEASEPGPSMDSLPVRPVVLPVVEREEMPEPVRQLEPRGRHWEPKADHDSDDDKPARSVEKRDHDRSGRTEKPRWDRNDGGREHRWGDRDGDSRGDHKGSGGGRDRGGHDGSSHGIKGDGGGHSGGHKGGGKR